MPFKAYLPKSLFGRALLIIMLPIVIMQMAVAYFFFNAHWNQVTANLSDSVAADVSVAVQLYKQDPTAERAMRLDMMLRPNMELSVALEENDELPLATRDAFFSNLDKTIFVWPSMKGYCALLRREIGCLRLRVSFLYFG